VKFGVSDFFAVVDSLSCSDFQEQHGAFIFNIFSSSLCIQLVISMTCQ